MALFLVLGTFTLAAAANLHAAEPISIHIDGKVVQSDVAPVIVNDRTMVPVRVISEELGRDVYWQPDKRQVIITTPGVNRELPLVSSPTDMGVRIFVDGRYIETGGQPVPFILKDRTMVPLRVIAEGLGMEVEWEKDIRRVVITTLPPIDNEVVDRNPATGENPPAKEPVGNGEPDPAINYGLTIMGAAEAGRAELLAIMQKNNPAAPRELVDLYLQIGKEYGVRGDVAFCQAAKETGWWKFGGLVQPYQYNYCGLGATGSAATGEEDLMGADPARVRYEAEVHGAIFDSPATGVEAHIQHLYAYACKAPLPAGKVLVDPRFIKPTRGIASRWIDLGGKWAFPGFDRVKYENDFQRAFANYDTYGHSILKDYYQKILDIKTN
ncbi:stalk domain-containing protein [Syntrophomonas curvata]